MHGIYANWDDAAFSSLCARLDLPKGKKVKDFSRGTKMKLAIPSREPQGEAARTGRGDRRP